MSVPGTPDEQFLKSFFSTPSAFHSIIISNPDKPPQAVGVQVKEEEENAIDNSSFRPDNVKVTPVTHPSTNLTSSTPSRQPTASSLSRTKQTPTSRPPAAPLASPSSATPEQLEDKSADASSANDQFIFLFISFFQNLYHFLNFHYILFLDCS